MEQGISYRDFINQVEAHFLEFMPEAYQDHHVTIEEIEIFDGRLEILGVLGEDCISAPGINLRDYFRKFLGCWNMEKVMQDMAADYQKLDCALHQELEKEGILPRSYSKIRTGQRQRPARQDYER